MKSSRLKRWFLFVHHNVCIPKVSLVSCPILDPSLGQFWAGKSVYKPNWSPSRYPVNNDHIQMELSVLPPKLPTRCCCPLPTDLFIQQLVSPVAQVLRSHPWFLPCRNHFLWPIHDQIFQFSFPKFVLALSSLLHLYCQHLSSSHKIHAP